MARLTDPIPDTIYLYLEKEFAEELCDVLNRILCIDDDTDLLSLDEYNTLINFSHTLSYKLSIGD